MNLQLLPGVETVRVQLQLDSGDTGGVQLADAELRQLLGQGQALLAAHRIDDSTIEWRDIPVDDLGAVLLQLQWRALEPAAATTAYRATITVWGGVDGGLLPGRHGDLNPTVRTYHIGGVVDGIGIGAEAIHIS